MSKIIKNIISVTPSAITQIKKVTNLTKHIGIKIGIEKTGCSGNKYMINNATKDDIESNNFDIVKIDNLSVLVDKKATIYVIGTIIDYHNDDISSGFSLNNPKSKETCGCGKSFKY